MTISVVLVCLAIYALFIAVVAWLSFYLGRTKTENPKVAAMIGGMLAFIPPLALVYLAMLTLKADVDTV